MKKIGVIGCGVIGLTTAIRLQEAGYFVTIRTKELPFNTVSAKAAAIWLPFEVEPLEKVNQWSKFTYHKMEALSHDPNTGISMVDFLVLAQNNDIPNWKAAMPEQAFRPAQKEELPKGYSFGNIAHVPLIETPVYLRFLLEQFKNHGGKLILKALQSMDDLEHSYLWTINCTGLGAKVLVGDESLYSIRGQIIKVDPIKEVAWIADDDGPNALAYVIPRQDCIVLGGTAQKNNDSSAINPEDTKAILHHCQNLNPNLSTITVQSVEVGLRPARPEIRLEKEPDSKIIHNYGHGGGGFTVSWGCAEEVLGLIV